MDFIFVLSSSKTEDGPTAVIAIGTALQNAGFAVSRELWPIDFLDQKGIFREADEDANASWTIEDWPMVRRLLAAHAGGMLSVGFKAGEVRTTLDVSIAAHPDGYVNVFVKIPYNRLKELYSDRNEHSFYRAVVIVAEAIHALAGFGEIDPDLFPISPSAAAEAVWLRPQDLAYPSSVGLLAADAFDESEVTQRAAGRFKIRHYIMGYTTLEENDFLDIVR